MNAVLEVLKISIPALIVAGVSWWIIRAFLKKEQATMANLLFQQKEAKRIELLKESQKTILPLRLQAYERLTIFLSRIELGSVVSRTNATEGMSAHFYKTALQHTIEEEFNHNITQQVYMTDDLWSIIILAKKEATTILEKVFHQLPSDKPAVQDYLEALAGYSKENPQMLDTQAILAIKKEVAVLFE
jgi:hypothetical protein